MPVMTTPIMSESEVRAAVERELPGVRADLERLVRIPGIAFDGFDHAVHSGMFGGAVPDALTTLAKLLATLHDDAGDVVVEGLVGREGATVDYPEDRFRAEAGLVYGAQLFGRG